MDNIPNLSYDSSGSFNVSQTQSRSIRLESDDEPSQFDSIHHDKQIYQNSYAFQKELERLKAQSTRKFQSKWEQILQKYSNIDDERESDEIDLLTGKITIDNGHLKSLKSQLSHDNTHLDGNIWAVDYDWERDQRATEKKIRDNKQQLKSRLKKLNQFHNSSSAESVDEVAHKRAPLDDNLILNPSPTKKTRLSSSPVRGDSFYDKSPTKSVPVESDSDTSPIKNAREKVRGNSSITPSKLFDLSGALETPTDGSSFDLSISSNIVHPPFVEKSTTQVSDTFEEEYSVLTDYLRDGTSQVGILNCAIDNCFYCTGNKSLYQQHLLEKHLGVLHKMGYPVDLSENEKSQNFSPSSFAKLISQFPLKYSIPPLALSASGEPFRCGQEMDSGRLCQKFFLSLGDLKEHRGSIPSNCSHKKQVLVCPLLGCGFMTDGGYLEWRSHFIEMRHHLDPDRINQKESRDSPEKRSYDRYNINQEMINNQLEINDDLDELFSDKSGIESDLEDSDDSNGEIFQKESPDDFPKIDHSEFLRKTAGTQHLSSSLSISMPKIEPRQVSIQGVPSLTQSQVDYDFDADTKGYESIDELFQN